MKTMVSYTLLFCFSLFIGSTVTLGQVANELAGNDSPFAGGSGTTEEPYKIETIVQLQKIYPNYLDSDFILIADVDASDTENWNDDKGFHPIGTQNNPFEGSLDGGGYIISDLFIDRGDQIHVGLFGYARQASFTNIILRDAVVTGGGLTGALIGRNDSSPLKDIDAVVQVSGGNSTGGLIGYNFDATITNSFTSGSVVAEENVGGLIGVNEQSPVQRSGSSADVHGSKTGTTRAGGLIGLNTLGDVEKSFSTGDVSGNGNRVGGLIGDCGRSASIIASYATGSVQGNGSYNGGLVGYGDPVINSYATGDVSGGRHSGGLVGWVDTSGKIKGSFASGVVMGDNTGGLVGRYNGNAEDSYWDVSNSGQNFGTGGGPTQGMTGLMTSQMTATQAYYEMDSFDFENTWHLTEGYPALQWQDDVEILPLPPRKVELIEPANASTDHTRTPTFSWNVDNRAETYRIQLSNDSNFESPLFYETTSTSEWMVTDSLDFETTWYWRVRAVNESAEGIWSDSWSFTTVFEPEMVTLVHPVDPQDTVSALVQMEWEPADHAAFYDLQISADEDFAVLVEKVEGLEGHIFTLSEPLDSGTTWFWRVRSGNIGGTSQWSETASFTTIDLPASPVLSEPDDAVADQEPDLALSWQAAARADGYELQVSVDAEFNEIERQLELEATEYSPEDLFLFAKTYFWRVRAYNSAGYGEWSEVRTFSVLDGMPDPVTLISPEDGDSDLSALPTLQWSESRWADRYEVQISALQDDFSDPVYEHSTEALSHQLSDSLDAGNTWFWRVRAVGIGGESAWSPVSSFSTINLPEQVVLTEPAHESEGVLTSVRLRWEAADRAVSYRLQLSEESDFSVVEEATSENAFYIIPRSLDYGRTYYWRVKAQNQGGESAWSDPFRFRTAASPIGLPEEERFNRTIAVHERQSMFIINEYLHGMGDNHQRRLGLATGHHEVLSAELVAHGVRFISSGNDHSFYILEDNTLMGMGRNEQGELGLGHTDNPEAIVQIDTDVVHADQAFQNSVYVKADGTLWQMGAMNERTRPRQVATGVLKAEISRDAVFFLKNDNTLWAFGENRHGTFCRSGHRFDDPVQVAEQVWDFSLGENRHSESSHLVVLKNNGELYGVGRNHLGQLGLDPDDINESNSFHMIDSDVKAVRASESQTIYIKLDNTLWGLGSNELGQLQTGDYEDIHEPVLLAENVADAAAGIRYLLYRDQDDRLWGVGNNRNGQLGLGDTDQVETWTEIDYRDGYRTWHVSSDGSNATGDGSESSPFETLQYAIDKAGSMDTVSVSAGTYNEDLQITKPLVILAPDGADQTHLTGSGSSQIIVHINGDWQGLNVFMDGFTVSGSGQNSYTAFRVERHARLYLDRSRVKNLPLVLHTYYGNYTVRNSLFHNNHRFADNDVGADDLYNEIIHSVVHEHEGGITGGNADNRFINSIITRANTNQPGENYFSGARVLLDHTLIDQEFSVRSGSEVFIHDHAGFMDPANGDFRLQKNSPAIGAGRLIDDIDTDYDGNPRPDPPGSQPDLGAFEHPLPDPAAASIVLIWPANGATGLEVLPELTWQGSDRADSYQLQVASDNSFSSLVVDTSGVEGTSHELEDSLDHLSTYYWRVRGLSDGYPGLWSEIRSFVTIIQQPEPVTLVAPDDESVGHHPPFIFSWHPADRAESYRLQLAGDVDFDFILADTTVMENQVSVPAEVNPAQQLYWRVKAENEAGTSQWSNVRSITAAERPAMAQLVAPADSSFGLETPVSFSWNPSDRAIDYRLKIYRKDPSGEQLVLDQLVSDTSYSHSDFSHLNVYKWTVQAVNALGEADSPDMRYFTIKITSPQQLWPEDGDDQISRYVKLTLSPVEGALGYQIELAADSLFEDLVGEYDLNVSGGTGEPTELPDVIFTAGPLQWHTSYYWRSRSYTEIDTSRFSEPSRFTIGSPELVFEPETIDFGTLRTGYMDSRSLKMTNTGSDTLFINEVIIPDDRIGIALPDSLQPVTSQDTIAAAEKGLPPGVTLEVDIVLDGHTPGTVETDLAISDGMGFERTLRVEAFIGSPELKIDPDTLIFASTRIGELMRMPVTLTNIGNDTLFVQSVIVSSGTYGSSLRNFTLVPDEAIVDSIAFAPSINPASSGHIVYRSADNHRDTLFVKSNTVPVVDRPDDLSIISGQRELTTGVQLSAGESMDPDGGDLSYRWYLLSNSIEISDHELLSEEAEFTFDAPVGTNQLRLTVTDANNASDSADFRVNVTTFAREMASSVEAGITAYGDSVNYNLFIADISFTPGVGSRIFEVDKQLVNRFDLTVPQAIRTAASVSADSSVFITNGPNLNGFDKRGLELWPTRGLGGAATVTPTIDTRNRSIYVGVTNNNLFAYDYQTGENRWVYRVDAPISASAVITRDNRLVFPTQAGTLYGFDLDAITGGRDAEPSWQQNFDDGVVHAPAIDSEDHIIVGTLGGNLLKISLGAAGNMALLWDESICERVTTSPVIDGEGDIYFGCDDGKLYKIDGSNGGVIWTHNSGGIIASTPAISNYGRIYFGNDEGVLTALNLDGERVWVFYNNGGIQADVLHISGTTYIGTMDGFVYGFFDDGGRSELINAEKAAAKSGSAEAEETMENNEEVVRTIIPQWGTYMGNNRRTGWASDRDDPTATDADGEYMEIPSEFRLSQNYPNPFNPATRIVYDLPVETHVRLEVFNMLGQRVQLLVNEHQSPGTHSAEFDGTTLASGIYIYRLVAGGFAQTRTMVMIK